MSAIPLRRDLLTRPIFAWAKGAMPALSATEREAIEAGDVWWDAELFTGNPDWQALLDTPPARLSAEEAAFLDGPVNQFCAMLDDWKINWELRDLPVEAWTFLKEHRFFGMIIPRQYGGLGFSAFAHSEVIRRISTRSVAAAVTAMVPNSLGPGELILRFGTKAQQDYWLPRLADGSEIPAFGLTSPEAGSDAASMVDRGVVVKREDGQLAIRLNWHKRYITLGPVCTVLGLAFKLSDPDHLLGEREEIGITCALVPTDTKGVEIGRRHIPSLQSFQNGPNVGRDVVIPMDHVIGGVERVGQGWKHADDRAGRRAGHKPALPIGRRRIAFSRLDHRCLRPRPPASSTRPYRQVRGHPGAPRPHRRQRLPARRSAPPHLRRAGPAATIPPSSPSLMKQGATERMRVAVDDAMDVHAGKAVIDGPKNYMGAFYRSVPVGITVEGANILTRSPDGVRTGRRSARIPISCSRKSWRWATPTASAVWTQFDEVSSGSHVAHTAAHRHPRWRAEAGAAGSLSPVPDAGRGYRPFYAKMGQLFAAAFALTSDVAFLTLGGALEADGAIVRPPRRHPVGALLPLRRPEAVRGRGAAGLEDFPLLRLRDEDGLPRPSRQSFDLRPSPTCRTRLAGAAAEAWRSCPSGIIARASVGPAPSASLRRR